MFRKNFIFLLVTVALLLSSKVSSAQQSTSEKTTITIKDIKIVGNSIFSDRELKSILGGEDKPLSFSDLLTLRLTITDYYVAAGYISSGAYLPPQKPTGNEVTINVVEGEVTKIEILNQTFTDRDYLLERIPIQNKIFNINLLKKYLEQLQNKPFIEKISAELTSTDSGQLNLALKIIEKPRLSRQFSFSNAYAPGVGSYGGNARFGLDVFGYGDRAILSFAKTEGLERISLDYSIPVNKYDTNLLVGYTNARSELIEDDIAPLDITGDFQSYQIGLNQSFKLQTNSQLDLGLSFKLIDSETFVLDDFSFAFVEGLDNGNSHVSELSFQQNYSTRSNNSSLLLSSQFDIGIDVFNPTISEQGRDSLYWNWLLKAENLRKLSSKLNLYSQFALQLTPDQLLPVSQISLGGTGSVRGYQQNFTLGDNGFFLSTEVQYSIQINQNSQIKLLTFVEGGKVWNNNLEQDGLNDLLSIGLGIEYSLFNLLNFRVVHGIPLIDPQEDFSSSFSDRTTLTFTLFD